MPYLGDTLIFRGKPLLHFEKMHILISFGGTQFFFMNSRAVLSPSTGRLRLWLISLFALVALCVNAFAATSDYSVRTWQIDDGSNNTIVGIAQASDGYLWIATLSALNRFDGLNFAHHPVGTYFGLPDSNVRCILTSSDGSLWAAMDSAVAHLTRDKPAQIIRDGIPSYKFNCMVEDNQGALWIGYHTNVVCRIKDGKATVFGPEAGVPKGLSTSLAVDSKGQVWLAEGEQVGVMRDGHFVKMFTSPGLSSLGAAQSGGLWVCAGLSLYKYDDGQPLKFIGTLPVPRQIRNRNSTPLTPFEDKRGTVWIGTLTDGLYRFTNPGFEKVGISQVRITCFAEDHEGNIWVGTDAGVDRLSTRAVEVESAEGDVSRPAVVCLAQDRKGTIWATMADGSFMIRSDNQWIPAPVRFNGDASYVATDPQGAVWMGSESRHLYRWKDDKVDVWDESRGLGGRYITGLLPDENGDMWIAATAPDAVMRLHDGHLISYRLPSAAHRIDTIAKDHAGNIWMGWIGTRMDTGGLLEISNDHIIDARQMSGITRPIQAMLVTDDGTLLIGCRIGGITYLRNGVFGAISTPQGLYDENIMQIVSDGRGWIWFGSSHGIFKVRQRDLTDFADGKISRVQSVQYGHDEGLPFLQGTRGLGSAIRTSDGQIWMAMATGLAIIHPDRVREAIDPPQVHIERVNMDDKTIASLSYYFAPDAPNPIDRPGFVLKLPPDYHRLEIDFTSLTYSSPENARFRYKLENFDTDWTEISNPRQAVYSRLPAGNYRFRVVGSSADGNWSPHEAVMAIAVAPFIWQMWWFQIGCAILFAASVLLLVRVLSFRRLRRRLEIAERRSALDRERDRIARDIHDDLGHGLTQIVLLSELTLHNHMPANQRDDQLGQIVTTAKQGLRSLDETVWAINPRNDTLPDLVDYLGHFVMKSLATADIRCRLDLPDYPPNLAVPADVRHSLFLVVKEAINNIICHASASLVQLTVKVTDDALAITIEDDGQGFAFGESSPGQDGLLNMRKRMSDIGGEFKIESKVGAGTKISLRHTWRTRTRIPKMTHEN
jgi:signal transduction histidine kinase/ligand-binding sensor domain-containing protein